MNFRYIGPLDECTIRHMTFEKGKAVKVDDDELAVKLRGIPVFAEVKAGRPKNADKE